jgi:tetratricopeptide (TPR) repeat protein
MTAGTKKSLRFLSLVAVCLMPVLPVELPASEKSEKRARIGSLIRISNQHLAAGQYDSVMVTLEQVRELDPDNPDAMYCEALTHLALADTVRALEVLSDGVARAPLSGRIKLLLVRLHLIDGRIAEADELLDTLLRFKSRDPETLYLKGMVNLAKGDSTLALDNWQSALDYLENKGGLQ